MAKRNAIGLDVNKNADGFDIAGGTTSRKLTLTGGDLTLTNGGGGTYTFPGSSTTLVGTDSLQTLTNKTISTASNTIIVPISDLASSGSPVTFSQAAFDTTFSHTTGLFAFSWSGNTSTNSMFKISSTNTSATGYLLDVVADNTGSSIKPFRIQARQTTVFDTDNFGNFTLSPRLQTSGAPSHFTFTGAAHTGLTASTEITDINFNLARTMQRAAGSVTLDRAFRIQGRTISFVSSSTVTDAINLDIETVTAGTNATITRSTGLRIKPSVNTHHGLWVDGPVSFTGDAAAFGFSGSKLIRFVGSGGKMNAIFNDGGDLGDTGTDGFIYIPQYSSSSAPTGTPTYTGASSGSVPFYVQKDSVGGNYRQWLYMNGAWRRFSSVDSTDTLTNKTISGSSNTLSNIGNSSLTNSSLTINGTSNQINTTSSSVSLGASATLSLANVVNAAVALATFYRCV